MSTETGGTFNSDRNNAMMGSAAAFSGSEPETYRAPPAGYFDSSTDNGATNDGASGDQQSAAANSDSGTMDDAGAANPKPPGDGSQASGGQASADSGQGTGAGASNGSNGASDSSGSNAPGQVSDGGASGSGSTGDHSAGGSSGSDASGSGTSTTGSTDGSPPASGGIGSSTPPGLLDGTGIDLSGVTNVLGVTGTTGLLNNLDLPLVGNGALHLAGQDAVTQPVLDVVDTAVLDVNGVLDNLSHQTGTSDLVHSVTNLGETVGLGMLGMAPGAGGNSNLLTDTLNLPGDTLNGQLGDSLNHIGGDLSDVVNASLGVGNAVLDGSDALNPLPELIHSVGSDLQSTPLLTINGDTGNGLLNGVAGDLTHSSSGHAIDVGVDGIGTAQNGLGLDLLSTESSDASPIHVSALDVGTGGPTVADIGLDPGSLGLGQTRLPINTSGLNDTLHGLTSADGLGQGLDGVLGQGGVLGETGNGLLGNVVGQTGSDLTNGPLLTVNDGNQPGGHDLLGASALDLTGSSTGHLADANVDGVQTSQGLVLDALAAPGGDPSPIDVNAVDVGSNGPNVADVGVDTGGHMSNVLGLTNVASANQPTTPLTDVDLSHDLGGLAGSLDGAGADHGVLTVNGAHII